MNDIIELRQISENTWQAKYRGNYGIYTIKIGYDGKKRTKFSCTCPSDYSPCKHIGFIEEAIAERISQDKKTPKQEEVKLEELLKTISREELYDFILSQAKYNPELSNAILLEFTPKTGNKRGNTYSLIIRKAIKSIRFYDDEYYSEEPVGVDVLDQWLEKAQDCLKKKNYDEAVLIAKALIEETGTWLSNDDEDIVCMIDPAYFSEPFDILENAAKHTGEKELFDYCFSELKKEKYETTGMGEGFHRLFMKLAISVDPGAFTALQDELLSKIKDKKSDEAEVVLQRKIDFYNRANQSRKAWEIIEQNTQIEYFRKSLAEKKFKENDFTGAKQLINDFLNAKENKGYDNHDWKELLLKIAQNEKDTRSVRELSGEFIKDCFDKKYFSIYKETFSAEEWGMEKENLFRRYDAKGRYFNHSAAELLAAENEPERLLDYVEKYCSIDNLEQYYRFFASGFPEKTISLFQKTLDAYAANNTGRSYYEHIRDMLKKMSRIKGGKKAAADLVADYRIHYKNRRAMLDVLKDF